MEVYLYRLSRTEEMPKIVKTIGHKSYVPYDEAVGKDVGCEVKTKSKQCRVYARQKHHRAICFRYTILDKYREGERVAVRIFLLKNI